MRTPKQAVRRMLKELSVSEARRIAKRNAEWTDARQVRATTHVGRPYWRAILTHLPREVTTCRPAAEV
jgi:hypothetical protein